MSVQDDQEIERRYRAYCDACESNQLEKLRSFWKLPAQFFVSSEDGQVFQRVFTSYEDLIEQYGTFFGPSTGVTKTTIKSSEIFHYGENLAAIRTGLEHWSGERLHDTQDAIYVCVKDNGEWFFHAHVSQDVIV